VAESVGPEFKPLLKKRSVAGMGVGLVIIVSAAVLFIYLLLLFTYLFLRQGLAIFPGWP
jgi:hypothetical protein